MPVLRGQYLVSSRAACRVILARHYGPPNCAIDWQILLASGRKEVSLTSTATPDRWAHRGVSLVDPGGSRRKVYQELIYACQQAVAGFQMRRTEPGIHGAGACCKSVHGTGAQRPMTVFGSFATHIVLFGSDRYKRTSMPDHACATAWFA